VPSSGRFTPRKRPPVRIGEDGVGSQDRFGRVLAKRNPLVHTGIDPRTVPAVSQVLNRLRYPSSVWPFFLGGGGGDVAKLKYFLKPLANKNCGHQEGEERLKFEG
jgi:hypothetical protein